MVSIQMVPLLMLKEGTQGKKPNKTHLFIWFAEVYSSSTLSLCHFVYKTARPIDDRPPQAELRLRFHANLLHIIGYDNSVWYALWDWNND